MLMIGVFFQIYSYYFHQKCQIDASKRQVSITVVSEFITKIQFEGTT